MGPERTGREEDSSSVSDSFKALVASNLCSSSSGLSISLAHSSHTCPTWPHRPYLLFLYLFKQLLLSRYSFSGVTQILCIGNSVENEVDTVPAIRWLIVSPRCVHQWWLPSASLGLNFQGRGSDGSSSSCHGRAHQSRVLAKWA